MVKLKSLFIIFSTLLASCGGVKFANAPVNLDLPKSFTDRTLYPAGDAAYDFQDLVGNILLVKENEQPSRIGLIRPDNYKNIVIPITDPNNYYKSRIQKGAEAKGSYLAFAASFTNEQLAEYELIDIARSGIVLDSEEIFNQIVRKIVDWIGKHPKTDNISKRLWVKSTVLTKETKYNFTKVEVNASGQIGEVVGVSTGVYLKNDLTTRGVFLSFESFDVDKLVNQIRADSSQVITLDFYKKQLDKARSKTPVIGKIRN
ncbi:hypothetical protein [Flavobacterium sp.]|uniref:hypothetical protein n=1 Tax=Flavobacterium sp. TaxID=239 RepID=UPI00374D3876